MHRLARYMMLGPLAIQLMYDVPRGQNSGHPSYTSDINSHSLSGNLMNTQNLSRRSFPNKQPPCVGKPRLVGCAICSWIRENMQGLAEQSMKQRRPPIQISAQPLVTGGADTDRWSAAPSKIHKIRHFYSPLCATRGATMPPGGTRSTCSASYGTRCPPWSEHHGTWSWWAGDVFYCKEEELFQHCYGTLNC